MTGAVFRAGSLADISPTGARREGLACRWLPQPSLAPVLFALAQLAAAPAGRRRSNRAAGRASGPCRTLGNPPARSAPGRSPRGRRVDCLLHRRALAMGRPRRTCRRLGTAGRAGKRRWRSGAVHVEPAPAESGVVRLPRKNDGRRVGRTAVFLCGQTGPQPARGGRTWNCRHDPAGRGRQPLDAAGHFGKGAACFRRASAMTGAAGLPWRTTENVGKPRSRTRPFQRSRPARQGAGAAAGMPDRGRSRRMGTRCPRHAGRGQGNRRCPPRASRGFRSRPSCHPARPCPHLARPRGHQV